MADQFEVLTEALRQHARKIDDFAGRLAQAVDAAREVSLPSDAYGVACLDLPMLLNPLQYLGMAALDRGRKQLSTSASAVEDAAAEYTAVDDYTLLALHRAIEVP